MAVFTRRQKRTQVSYTNPESGYFNRIEKELMEDLHIKSISGLHKYALKFLHVTRKPSEYQIFWTMKTIQIATIYFEMLKQMMKSKKANNPRQVVETIISNEFKKLGF